MSAICALAFAVAATPSGRELEHFDRLGISFDYPTGWFVTTKPLSKASDPAYRFAATSVPVQRTRRDIGPCLPGIARQLPRDALLIFLREYTGASRRSALPRLGPRPRLLRLSRDTAMCGFRGPLRGAWVNFREAGRAFVLGIHLGPTATKTTELELRRLVASLRIRPR